VLLLSAVGISMAEAAASPCCSFSLLLLLPPAHRLTLHIN
jgi:hypothetical protein